MSGRIQRLCIVALSMVLLLVDDTASCPAECVCGWASGNKLTDCARSGLRNIPEALSAETQVLDLTGNELFEIKRNAFEDVGVINLKKLILRECKLTTIDKNALSGLAIMIQLDLSKNELKTLHADTFKETTKIRSILLNDNQIEKLEDRLFSNLAFLHKVDLSNNRIVQLGMKTFVNVPQLDIIIIDGNKFDGLKKDTVSASTSVSNGDVHDNTCRCDC